MCVCEREKERERERENEVGVRGRDEEQMSLFKWEGGYVSATEKHCRLERQPRQRRWKSVLVREKERMGTERELHMYTHTHTHTHTHCGGLLKSGHK